MNNLIILIILTITSIFFLIRIQKKGNKSEALSFLATMIATLFGVLLAVTLSNIESKKKEMNDTIKLLNTAQSVIEATYAYTNGLGEFDLSIKQDSSKYEFTQKEFRKNNPFPHPVLLESIIANELVSKNISEMTHTQIYVGVINLQKIDTYDRIESYKKSLEDMHLLIQFEVEYLKRNISLEELQSQDKSKIDVKKIEKESTINLE